MQFKVGDKVVLVKVDREPDHYKVGMAGIIDYFSAELDAYRVILPNGEAIVPYANNLQHDKNHYLKRYAALTKNT